MEKTNKKLVYEATLLNKAFWSELDAITSDVDYSRHHTQNKDWYMSLSSRYQSILGYTGTTEEELISYVSTLQLTDEQKRALHQLRKEPMFKRLFGQTSLAQKEELQTLLGAEIKSEGMTFADENGARVSIKGTDILDKEWDTFSAKLDDLLSSGQISSEQYDKYTQSLDYIYGYFMSQSKGEQIPFRKMTDSEYLNIERMAEENGISFSEQMSQINQEHMFDFEQVQEVAQSVSHKSR